MCILSSQRLVRNQLKWPPVKVNLSPIALCKLMWLAWGDKIRILIRLNLRNKLMSAPSNPKLVAIGPSDQRTSLKSRPITGSTPTVPGERVVGTSQKWSTWAMLTWLFLRTGLRRSMTFCTTAKPIRLQNLLVRISTQLLRSPLSKGLLLSISSLALQSLRDLRWVYNLPGLFLVSCPL